jgi:hypothetical protein
MLGKHSTIGLPQPMIFFLIAGIIKENLKSQLFLIFMALF